MISKRAVSLFQEVTNILLKILILANKNGKKTLLNYYSQNSWA